MRNLLKMLLFLILSVSVLYAENEIKPELVTFDKKTVGSGVIGALYKPKEESKKSEVAVLIMHAEQDYFNFPGCSELAKRGYTVLCVNNSASKTGTMTDLDFETMMLDVSKGVKYLREQSSIKKVVLLGHSGGGAMMSAYQNIAENGLPACQGAEKISPCSDKMKDLPKADGIILLDANFGISGMTLLSMNPAITDEKSGISINSELDIFNEKNGFTANGATYSKDFTKTFQSGVSERMNKLIAYAKEREKIINEGKGLYKDDEPMIIPDAIYVGFNNKFFPQDTRFLSKTSKAWPLIHKDGTITTEIVHSVRPAKNLKNMGQSYNGSIKTTVKKFLKTFAVKTDKNFSYNESEFKGVDWSSSHTATIGAVKGIKSPLLTLGMTGNWEFLAAEKIYLSTSSKDKTVAFVEGAAHSIETCTQCEKTPGQYGDTIKTTFDYVDKWLSKKGRFY